MHPGGKLMTSHIVDKFLIDLLLDGLERVLPAQQRLGLTLQCGMGEGDNTMAWTSAYGRTVRPDGLLRSSDGMLLFKWEETAGSVGIHEAEEALRSKALQPLCSTSCLLPSFSRSPLGWPTTAVC